MKTANIRLFIFFLFFVSLVSASGMKKQGAGPSEKSDPVLLHVQRERIQSLITGAEAGESLRDAASQVVAPASGLRHFRRIERPEAQDMNRPASKRVKDAFHRSGAWQDFGRNTQTGNLLKRAKTLVDPPTILINNDSVTAVAALEDLEILVTLTDSALVEIFYDANGDTVVDTGDLNLFDVRFPFDDEMPEGSFYIYDNDWEDEDPAAGSFRVTVDDFPYVGIPVIMRVTDAGGSATAYLDIAALQGQTPVSGSVITGNSNPGMVFLAAGDEDRMVMTFTDSSGGFNFGVDFFMDDMIIGAVDAYLTVETGQFLAKVAAPWMAWDVFGTVDTDLELDITRDAAVTGVVFDENSNGLPGAGIGAGGKAILDAVIAFTRSDTNGHFILPLQSGFEYMMGSAHPDYMESPCLDIPLVPSPGDTFNIVCELEPWPAFVEGTVTDINTLEPLEDIEIELGIWPHDSTDNGDSTYYGDDHEEGFFFGDGYWRYTWSDEYGFYRLGSVLGTGFICAYDWDYMQYQHYCLSPFVVDQSLVTEDIAMTPWDGMIYGTVTDSVTGNPIPDAAVYLAMNDNSDSTYYYPSGWTHTNQDGYFEIPAMNGSYRVCASFWDMGYHEVCDSVTVNNDSVQVNLQVLPPDGLIFGYITDAVTGDSLPGISVELDGADHGYRHVLTDSSGYYEFGVDNGSWDLCVFTWTNLYHDTCVTDISVSEDSVQVNVALEPLVYDGAVAGTVLDVNSDPVMAVIFGIDNEGADEPANMTLTQSDGSYFLPLDNGAYILGAIAMDPGYFPAFDSAVVNFDTVEVNFVLSEPVPDAVIYGQITDSTGTPLAGAEVIAGTMGEGDFMPFGYMAYGESDSLGNYALDVVGYYNLYYWVAAQYLTEDSLGYLFDYVDGIPVQTGDSVRVNLVLTMDGGYHDWEAEAVQNKHGNFRFHWGSQGHIMDGEWPAGSGTYYLAEGGLAIMGFGNMMADTVLAGYASVEDSVHWENMGGWTKLSGIGYSYMDDRKIYRGMEYGDHMGYGLQIGEKILTPDSADFVLIGTQISNHGNHSIKDLAAGYVTDWDVAMSDTHDSYDDDYAGSMTVMVTHPTLPVEIPVKISYMMDDDGDSGKSPGVVGMATLAEPVMSVTHVSVDITENDPETDEEVVSILSTTSDSPDATIASDYVTLQILRPGDLEPGDTLRFATLLMAADDTTAFQEMLEDAMSLLATEFLTTGSEPSGLPESFSLLQNYPNPFNPVTKIRYSLPRAEHVNLTVYDILGREVVTLVNRREEPGFREVTWNGRNDEGQKMSGGVYLYRIQAGSYTRTMKMILLK